jgi:nucleotide-binding universal stress UspA family protein
MGSRPDPGLVGAPLRGAGVRNGVLAPSQLDAAWTTLEIGEALTRGGGTMTGGTIVCGVTETPDGRSAAELARALVARLGLRLVLVHVLDGVPPGTHESVTARQRRAGAEQILNAIASDIGDGTERRIVVGSRAEALAQVAAEEGADLIVIGSRSAGLASRKLRCTLARELEAATSVPVVLAPPTTRRRSDQRLAMAAGATSG